MNAYQLLLIIDLVLCCSILSFLYARKSTNAAYHAYMLYVSALTWWLGCEIILQLHYTDIGTTQLIRLSSLGWLPIGLLFLRFSLIITNQRLGGVYRVLQIFCVTSLLLSLTTDLIVLDSQKVNLGWYAIQGMLYQPVIITVVFLPATLAVLLIFKSLHQQTNTARRKQLLIFAWGGSLTLLIGFILNVIAPTLFSYYDYVLFTTTVTTLQVIIVFCAVIKRRFSNICLEDISKSMFSQLNDGVIIADKQGWVIDINHAAHDILQLDKQAWKNEGRLLHEILPTTHNTPSNKSSKQINYININANKTLLIEQSLSPLLDRSGKKIGQVAILRDLSIEDRLNKKIFYQATHDKLTGLINRDEFTRLLENRIKSHAGKKTPDTLCYIDLDEFKVINDTCGQVAGDQLLKDVTKVILNNIRQDDTLARLGGDEFGLLLQGCSPKTAESISNTLCTALNKNQFKWKEHAFSTDCSIGIAAITGSAKQALTHADTACISAKELGRGQVCQWDNNDDKTQAIHGQMLWVPRINAALSGNDFLIFHQTISPLTHTEAGEHFEILLRMHDREKNCILAPGGFLPAAERFNLIIQVDRWVIENTFKLLEQRYAMGKQTPTLAQCSINLSGASLGHKGTCHYIDQMFECYKVATKSVCFEITETAAIANFCVAKKIFSHIKSIGCKLSLDDFGTGLSSLSYLKEMPVDYIKIDGAFIKNILNNPTDKVMVKSIVMVAHAMGIQTIAEFVENKDIMDFLNEVGVNYAQGYHIHKPSPLTA